MRTRKRLLGPLALATAFVALIVVASGPAVAQFDDSTSEEIIWNLNNNLLAIAVPITVLVEGILFYTVWRFRKTDEPQPTQENRRLEVTWTVATALVLLFVGFAAYGAMANESVITTPQSANETLEDNENAVFAEVVGFQWAWQVNYPNENVSGRQALVIPEGREVVLRTTSQDVNHAVHIPGIGVKMDALPGQYNYYQTTALDPGHYQLYCAEFCGTGHSRMLSDVYVVSNETYSQWLEDPNNVTLSDSGSASVSVPAAAAA